MSDSRTGIAELLRGAGQAHHHAFAAALAEKLRTVDAEHRAKAPSQDWAEYYADRFLSRSSP